ncbi:MAG: PAS domain S-box protein, partial [Gammaproteobacteria bacterium]
MAANEDEEKLLRSVALQNAKSVLAARQCAEQELIQAKAALELRTDELAHSLAMIRATLESTTDGILVTDGGGKVTVFSENFVEMWRIPRATMDSREHRQLLEVWGRQLKDPDQFRLKVEEIYASSPPESYDLLELVDGRVIERFSRIQRIDERNVGRVWSFRDITERRRADEALQKQSGWLRVTLASIGDAVMTTDTEGRITYLNAVAESLTGWKNDEATGQPLETVFRIINEQTRQPAANPAGRALKEGVIVGLANHSVLIRKDGTERPIDDSASPIKDERSHVAGVVLIFRDVTEKRRAEETLRQSEQRLRFVMDSMPQKIFTAEPNGDVDYFNPQWTEFTGLPFETIRGWGWTQFIHPDDLAENVGVWQQAIDSGEPFLFEHRFRRADGEYRWHLSRAVALKDAGGNVLMWVGSNTDIDEQKQMANEMRKLAAELSEVDRRKNEFLAMLAHELRNPLAPIRNALQILRLTGGDGTAVQSASAMMERQIGQMVRLVDDLLDVSRISRGKIELRRERIELASAVH